MNILLLISAIITMIPFSSHSHKPKSFLPIDYAKAYTAVIMDEEYSFMQYNYEFLFPGTPFYYGTSDTNCDGYSEADGLWNQRNAAAKFTETALNYAYTDADQEIYFLYLDPLLLDGDVFDGPSTVMGTGAVGISGRSSESIVEAASDASLESINMEDSVIDGLYQPEPTYTEMTLYRSYSQLLIGEDFYYVPIYEYYSSIHATLTRE